MKCQRNRDCLVGDFCNGGLLTSGICKTSDKTDYKSCVYDHLYIHIEKEEHEEKEDIQSFGKMRLTSVLKKNVSLLNSMHNIHRLMQLFDKKIKLHLFMNKIKVTYLHC